MGAGAGDPPDLTSISCPEAPMSRFIAVSAAAFTLPNYDVPCIIKVGTIVDENDPARLAQPHLWLRLADDEGDGIEMARANPGERRGRRS
jgi:hypothetical protein